MIAASDLCKSESTPIDQSELGRLEWQSASEPAASEHFGQQLRVFFGKIRKTRKFGPD